MRTVEFESLTKVAEILDVSKSTVSKAIQLLEDAIQLPLFVRSQKNFTLTPEGDIFYHECLQLEREVLNISACVSDIQTELQGILTINVIRSLVCQSFLNALTKYQQAYPKMSIDLILDKNNFKGEFCGEIDLYVTSYQEGIPEYIQRTEIFSITSMLCASPKYILAYGLPNELTDLINHQFIMYTQPNGLITSIHEKLVKEGIKVNSMIKINSINSIKECVVAGLGISELPLSCIENELKNGTLVSILPQFNAMYPIYAYHVTSDGNTPTKVKYFLELLLQEQAMGSTLR